MKAFWIVCCVLDIFLGGAYMFGLIEPNPISAGLFAIAFSLLALEKYVIGK